MTKNQQPVLLDATKEGAAISEHFLDRHEMVDTRQKVFMIKRFEDIGWLDPFPDEPMDVSYETEEEFPGGNGPGPRIPPNTNIFAYNEAHLIKGFVPTVIYIPSKEMMLSLIHI